MEVHQTLSLLMSRNLILKSKFMMSLTIPPSLCGNDIDYDSDSRHLILESLLKTSWRGIITTRARTIEPPANIQVREYMRRKSDPQVNLLDREFEKGPISANRAERIHFKQ